MACRRAGQNSPRWLVAAWQGKHQSGTTPAQHAINQAWQPLLRRAQCLLVHAPVRSGCLTTVLVLAVWSSQAQARVEAEGQARLDQAAAELHGAQEQLDARTKSLHAARVELADKERSVEAAKAQVRRSLCGRRGNRTGAHHCGLHRGMCVGVWALLRVVACVVMAMAVGGACGCRLPQLTTLIGMTKDLLQMLRPASDTRDGAVRACHPPRPTPCVADTEPTGCGCGGECLCVCACVCVCVVLPTNPTGGGQRRRQRRPHDGRDAWGGAEQGGG